MPCAAQVSVIYTPALLHNFIWMPQGLLFVVLFCTFLRFGYKLYALRIRSGEVLFLPTAVAWMW